MSLLTGRRAVLRLAVRDARRHRGRSALVVVMVALPVLVLSAVDVVARTAAVGSDGSALPTGAADAVVRPVGSPVLQTPDGTTLTGVGEGAFEQLDQQGVAATLGAERIVSDISTSTRYAATDGSRRLDLRQLDYADPLAAGLVRQLDGRAPRTPQEVAVSPELARLADVGLGDVLELTRPAAALTVVGTVDIDREGAVAVALPGAVPPEENGYLDVSYLVQTPGPVTWDDVLELNERGLAVTSPTVIGDPPERADVPYFRALDDSRAETETVALVVLAAGMALLEVVLLAGPAVAVGARRSRRVLALLAACGGDRRQVRDVVLGQGLALGGVAAAVGVGLGVPLGLLAVPTIERFTDTVLPAPVIRPLDLLALALLAVVTAVLASLVPARSVSRQDTALALAGRREPLRTRKRVPVLGLLLAGLGLALAVGGVNERSATDILAGAALGQVGLVLCTPTLITFAGRLGSVLPLAPRLALRDSVRHVGRTAPAVAAVMAAVAGSVAIGIFVASQAERDERSYGASLPLGDASVGLFPGQTTDGDIAAVEQIVTDRLPVRDAVVLRTLEGVCVAGDCPYVYAQIPPVNRCPLFANERDSQQPTASELDAAQGDPRCAGVFSAGDQTAVVAFSTLVDDGSTLAALTGVDDVAARTVLSGAGAVVFDPLLLDDGQALLRIESGQGAASARSTRVPAVLARSADGDAVAHGLVLSPTLAEQLGVTAQPTSIYLPTTRMPSEAEQEAATTALDRAGFDSGVSVERGYQDAYLPGILALVVGAAVITLGAAATATGLAMTDARPDLATLASVGATRGLRRRLSMSTALVITLLGTALGLVAGAVPGIAAVQVLGPTGSSFAGVGGGGWPLVVPWASLAATALVVPLIAAAGAFLFTRSRLPMTRRLAG